MTGVQLNNFIPISKVVEAVMVDMYADQATAGLQQRCFHHAVRGYQKLNNESLKGSLGGVSRVMLKVNKLTNTVTLPLGFKQELFIGIIDFYGTKVPLRLRSDIVDPQIGITEQVEQCPTCKANKRACRDLEITETTEYDIINGNTYERTIVKKMYPDGRYFLESRIPVLNIDTNEIEYTTQKQFIAKIELEDCGCPKRTEENMEIIKTCDPATYCQYYAPCTSATLNAGYNVLLEQGCIAFTKNFPHDSIYIEYRTFLPKVNGQYMIPDICLETLVNYVKFKLVENKPNVSESSKQIMFDRYRIERQNFKKVFYRFDLWAILDAATRLPKFEVSIEPNETYCSTTMTVSQSLAASVCDDCSTNGGSTNGGSGSSGSGGGSSTQKQFVPFSYAGIVGVGNAPVDGSSTYQNDIFKNALQLENIYIANTIYNRVKGDFTIDTVSGTISIAPNTFVSGDPIIASPFFKYQ